MRRPLVLACALLAAAAFGSGPASAANICRAGKLTCATTMPADGYCECTSHGVTESGSVEARPVTRHQVNSTAGGCGAHPNAPGCS